MFSTYAQSVMREAFPKIDSMDLFVATMGRLLALVGSAVFPVVNQWLQLVPPWAGALPILFYLFAWAPYRAWAAQDREVASLTDRLTPMMDMFPLTRGTPTGLSVGVVVTATTDAVLKGCTGHLTFGDGRWGSTSGTLSWSKQDGGASAIDIASHAFLEVVEILGYYHNQFRLRFASDPNAWITEGEPDKPKIRIRISAENSPSIEREFILVIDPLGANPRTDASGGWNAAKLPSVTLEPA